MEFRKLLLLGFVAFFVITCDNSMYESPDPGILRVVLSSDPADTVVTIASKRFVVSNDDSLGVKIFQGKVYHDTVYSFLYRTLLSYKQEEIVYNIIKLCDGGGYENHKIFESYVPPVKYDRIQFGVNPTVLRLSGYIQIDVINEGDVDLYMDIQTEFEVFEHETTEVVLEIKPLQSLVRYRDTYIFKPVINVKEINYR